MSAVKFIHIYSACCSISFLVEGRGMCLGTSFGVSPTLLFMIQSVEKIDMFFYTAAFLIGF